MNTEPLAGYGGYTPDELHALMRRAHEERARALRQMFASLFAWRHKAAPRGDVADAPLKVAACT